MGNQQSNYPERMLKLKNFQDLNDDIDGFNTKQLYSFLKNDKYQTQDYNNRNQKAMDALGFLIQFDEINYGGVKGLFKKFFFQQAISKIEINTNMLLDNKPYYFKLKVNEMYILAELLSRYTEDIETTMNPQYQQQEQQNQALSQIKIGRKKSSEQAVSHIKNESKEQDQFDNEEEQKVQNNSENQKGQQNKFEDTTNEEDRQCPLCLDARIKIILPCYHGYCDNCARKWIQEKQQKNCPMCRFQVEASQSKFNRTVMHIEDDVDNVNQLVKNQIIQIILQKNDKIPLVLQQN